MFSLSCFANLLYKSQSQPKSILTFQKWTKKMSKNEKGRYTFEKASFVTEMNFYRLVTKKITQKL
jgi:hypothetical protein